MRPPGGSSSHKRRIVEHEEVPDQHLPQPDADSHDARPPSPMPKRKRARRTPTPHATNELLGSQIAPTQAPHTLVLSSADKDAIKSLSYIKREAHVAKIAAAGSVESVSSLLLYGAKYLSFSGHTV